MNSGMEIRENRLKGVFFCESANHYPRPHPSVPKFRPTKYAFADLYFFWAGHPICGKCIPHSRKHIVGQNGCLFR